MANRPVFVPLSEKPYVREINIEFDYNPGFSIKQKQKNIYEIHRKYESVYGGKLLEISTKSFDEVGVQLSAFNLQLNVPSLSQKYTVENVYQSGKIFENGGPYVDLLTTTPIRVKKDERLRTSGKIICFTYENQVFQIKPMNLFYDYLYIKALQENIRFSDILERYVGFTDIEFNPNKSINCQARAAARFLGLKSAGILNDVINDIELFKKIF